MMHIKIYEDYFDDKPKFIPTKLSHRINKNKPTTVYNILGEYAANKNISLHKLIDNIADKCGVKIDSLLAHGTRGYALNLVDGNIMKITNDISEATNAYYAKQFNMKHFVKIYAIYKFSLENEIFYVIIMEKIKPLTKKEVDIYERYIIDNIITSNIKISIEYIMAVIKLPIPKFVKDYIQLLEEFDEYNMSVKDLTIANIGYDNKRMLKAFDIGYHTRYDNINIEEIIL